MRILAIDVGTVRVGVAVSDELGILATPLEHYRRTGSLRKDARAVADIAEGQGVSEILVGHPVQMSDEVGTAALAAEEFAERLTRYTRIPVRLLDERLSSVEAERRLREAGVDSRKARSLVDSQAAAVLLESYLRSKEITNE